MPEDRAALLVSLRLEADADRRDPGHGSLIAAWRLKIERMGEISQFAS